MAQKILVVDDDEAIRDVVCFALEAQGYVVATAADGVQAIRMLRADPRPALVLLDLMLPDVSGWEVAEAMRRDPALATVPIRVMTAYVGRHEDDLPYPYLRKPFDLDELLLAVEQDLPASPGSSM